MILRRIGLVALVSLLILVFGTRGAAGPQSNSSPGGEETRGKAKLPLPPKKQGKYWAVVVGIDYKNRDGKELGNGIAPLPNAEQDARDVAETLRDYFGFKEVVLLLGSEEDGKEAHRKATGSNITSQLKSLFLGNKVEEEDSILFYFAGHGCRRPEKNVGEDFIGEIVPVDSKNDRPDQPFPDRATTILLKEIKDLMEQSKARSKLLILDCCHAGQLFNLPVRNIRLGAYADREVRQSKPCFWGATSCQSQEEASSGRDHNSPYTGVLLESMRFLGHSEPERAFTAQRLFDSVHSDFENNLYGTRQRPVAGPLASDKSGDGDFFFYYQLREGVQRASSLRKPCWQPCPAARATGGSRRCRG